MNDKSYAAHPLTGRPGASNGSGHARPHGTAETGQIVRLLVGQGCGFIRSADRREIYFHRGDLSEGTSFNGFVIGDTVAFELLEDRFSGPRALQVRRQP
jgi:cold shock CspA family protein